jgi:hypothetical protein
VLKVRVREAFVRFAAVHPTSLHAAHRKVTTRHTATGFRTAPLRVGAAKVADDFGRVIILHGITSFAWGFHKAMLKSDDEYNSRALHCPLIRLLARASKVIEAPASFLTEIAIMGLISRDAC